MNIRREEPGPGQESVWDYPRPPRVERTERLLQVYFAGELIAETRGGCRVLETSHPPVYYFPPGDVRMEWLKVIERRTFCEWKGFAVYYALEVNGRREPEAAWAYPNPVPAFEMIRDYIAFYPARMERCLVDGKEARAQAGGFYGGWITNDVVGPFKGDPGTMGW